MSASFFDTNTVLYLAGDDPAKAKTVEWLLHRGGFVSVQILNEFTNVSRRKRRSSWPEILDSLDSIRRLVIVLPLTIDLHERGLSLAQRHNFSTYDAMIVAAALSANCDTLWSEDMQNGMVVEGRLTIRDPFKPQPDTY